MSELIQEALTASTTTRDVLIGRSVLGQVSSAFTHAFGDRAAVVVGDERTMAVAGQAVHDALAAAGVPVLDPYVKTSTASRGPTVTYGPGAEFPTGRRVRRKPGDDPRQSPLERDDGPTEERD